LVAHETALHWYECLPGVQIQNKLDYISYRRDNGIFLKKDVLFQLKIRCASEKFEKPAAAIIKPTSVIFPQQCRNLSHQTVPLSIAF
jgi:hypothetical protein